jgi:hypothetical protein
VNDLGRRRRNLDDRPRFDDVGAPEELLGLIENEVLFEVIHIGSPGDGAACGVELEDRIAVEVAVADFERKAI